MLLGDWFKSREDLIDEGVATSFIALGTDNQGPYDKQLLRTYYESLPSKSAIKHDIQMVESEVTEGWCPQCGYVTECSHQ